ncbi:MAG: hypothetical protein J2P28_17220, partial [Actinobacteria bacterium]|nr:hypothetical protein [Actinomycetota bacterium]
EVVSEAMAEQIVNRAEGASATAVGPTDDVTLLRTYEPVLRFTSGELFLPMSVDSYLARCELWQVGPQRPSRVRGKAARICAPGELTPSRLAEIGAAPHAGALSLRFVGRPLTRREYQAWRHDPGWVRFRAGRSRFAAAGLLGRLIDAVMRLSLLLRGRVPGGTAAAAALSYRADADPHHCPYYAHVSREHGYIALQYWFLYAMNDWRSTFGGVNDHEADWEQVTVFLPDPPDLAARPAWVAFSSHDAVGEDLRRRHDDPDITWHGTHPTVYAGAGSHSGAYLPGDYLVTIEPPAVQRLLAAVHRVSALLLPWRKVHARAAVGIPFIDYHRGDGPAVGPGEQREWSPVLIDNETPWVRSYRGLWGLDTGDPFGGERAPAGPRYERSGRVRLSWSDPVGWAALDKEPPSAAAEDQAVRDRIAELCGQINAVEDELRARADELSRVHVGIRALDSAGIHRSRTALTALEASAQTLRARRQTLNEERELLIPATAEGLPPAHPHAHLRHRALPNVDPARSRHRALRWWSAVSASFVLTGLAVILLNKDWALVPAATGLALITLSLEALSRRRLAQFLAGLVLVALVIAVAWTATLAAIGHWRVVVASLLITSAVILLLANIRDFFRKR